MKFLLCAAALAAYSGAPAVAAGKITIAIAGSDKIVYMPAKLAERLGYFQAQGLEVELRGEIAGIEARDGLLSGAVQGVAADPGGKPRLHLFPVRPRAGLTVQQDQLVGAHASG